MSTHISLIARAAMFLMRLSERLQQTLTVRFFPSFSRYVSLTFIHLWQPLHKPSWTCFPGPPLPPSSSRQPTIFTTPIVVISTSSVGSTIGGSGPAIVVHMSADSAPFLFTFLIQSLLMHLTISYVSSLLALLSNLFKRCRPRTSPSCRIRSCLLSDTKPRIDSK